MFPILGYIIGVILFYLLTKEAVYRAVKKALQDYDKERKESSAY